SPLVIASMQLSSARRHLHSFPTRRSSDLFDDSDIEYLRGLTGIDGKPLFEPGFLDYLRALRFECDVDAIPEGTVVFPHEPLVRVDRKSTRLNSSHVKNSYAVFCLKKKKTI